MSILLSNFSVSIPQAVSAVATVAQVNDELKALRRFNTASGKCCCNSSTGLILFMKNTRFNTASGKCCCNRLSVGERNGRYGSVSIPQAVSAVATLTAL